VALKRLEVACDVMVAISGSVGGAGETGLGTALGLWGDRPVRGEDGGRVLEFERGRRLREFRRRAPKLCAALGRASAGRGDGAEDGADDGVAGWLGAALLLPSASSSGRLSIR